MKNVLLVLFLALGASNAARAGAELRRFFESAISGQPARDESIYRLVVQPERYEGQWIQTAGWLVIDTETSEICPSVQDGRYATLSNCVELILVLADLRASMAELLAIDGRHALVAGRIEVVQDCPLIPRELLEGYVKPENPQAECAIKARMVDIQSIVVSGTPPGDDAGDAATPAPAVSPSSEPPPPMNRDLQ